MRLTELGEGTQDIRRRVSLDELEPSANAHKSGKTGGSQLTTRIDN